MYIPSFNAVTDAALLHDFMRRYSFATLVTAGGEAPVATHLPFLLDAEAGEQGTLIAHMARANAHWKELAHGGEALVIFQGAHTYVSPSWYAGQANVPTWNYMVVHAYGIPRLIEDDARVREVLRTLVDKHEAEFAEPWPMELPEEYLRKMMRAIVAFEIPIARLEGKFKLSQNRTLEDQRRVIEGLASRPDEDAQAVRDMMQHVVRWVTESTDA